MSQAIETVAFSSNTDAATARLRQHANDLANLADVVRAMSEPLSKVDKITIVSTGNGNIGTHKLTGEMTEIAAQVPALFEALSGMKMSDLMANVKQMKPYVNGDGNNTSLR